MLGRNSDQGAVRTTDHSFGGASTEQVEQAGMSFGHHHDEIRTEISSCHYDPLNRIAFGDQCVPRPAGALGMGEFRGIGFLPNMYQLE